VNPSPSTRILFLFALALVGALCRASGASAQPPIPPICDGVETIELYTKPSLFRDKMEGIPGFDHWRIRGQFITSASFVFDPSVDPVTLVLNQDDTVYDVTVPPNSFQETVGVTVRWQFRLLPPQPDLPGAEGWRFARFRKVPSRVGPTNRVTFRLGGNNVELPIELNPVPGEPTVMRETLHFGNLCVTSVVSCLPKKENHQLRCFSLP
jgi:hypothetical protein